MTDATGDPICPEVWCQFLNGPEAQDWFEASMTFVFGDALGAAFWMLALWTLRYAGKITSEPTYFVGD